LPETNPIQTVIDEFVGKRFDYQNQKAKIDNSSQEGSTKMKKPRLEEFLKAFQEQVHIVNQTYKNSK
jgi:hypothetical protein